MAANKIPVRAYEYQPLDERPLKRRAPQEAFDELLFGQLVKRSCREDSEPRQRVVERRAAFEKSFRLQAKEAEQLRLQNLQDQKEIAGLLESAREKDAEIEKLREAIQHAVAQHASQQSATLQQHAAVVSECEAALAAQSAAFSDERASLHGENQVLHGQVSQLATQLAETQHEAGRAARELEQASFETCKARENAEQLERRLAEADNDMVRERARAYAVDVSDLMELKETLAQLEGRADAAEAAARAAGIELTASRAEAQRCASESARLQRQISAMSHTALAWQQQTQLLLKQVDENAAIKQNDASYDHVQFLQDMGQDFWVNQMLNRELEETLLWDGERKNVMYYYRRVDGHHVVQADERDLQIGEDGYILPEIRWTDTTSRSSLLARRALMCCFAQIPEVQLEAARRIVSNDRRLEDTRFLRRFEEKMMAKYGSGRNGQMRVRHARLWEDTVILLANEKGFQNSCISFIRGCKTTQEMTGCWPPFYEDASTQACSLLGDRYEELAASYWETYVDHLEEGREIDDTKLDDKLVKAMCNTRSGIGKSEEEMESEDINRNPWLSGLNLTSNK